MSLRNNHSTSQSGGAMIYIFIGIILFVLLAFTFSKSFTGMGTSVMTSGNSNLAASQIIDYSSSLEKAVQRLIAKGCSESQLNFDNEFVTGYTNPDAPVDKSCDIFSPGKGGVAWKKPPTGANGGEDWFIANHVDVAYAGTYVSPSDGRCNNGPIKCIELTVLLPNISEEICLAINKRNGLVPLTSSGLLPEDDTGPTQYNNADKFIGTFQPSYNDIDVHTFDGNNKSLSYGCTKNSNTSQYDYWKILLAR